MDLLEIQQRKGTEIKRHPWELARLGVVRDILGDILKNEENFSVLDIGCGDIFFVSSLSEKYPKAKFYAIDIAFTEEIISELSDNVREKNIFLFKSLDDAAAHLKKPADLVLLLDVVEHIKDDLSFLKFLHAHPAIDHQTKIMITVPAYQSLFCSHDRFLGHFRRYTNQTLLHTIRQCGFEKIKLGYFFFSLVAPRVLQVFKEKLFKPATETTGLVEWKGGSATTNFIKKVLLFDYRFTKAFAKLTGIKFPGLSNYILCKKSAS